MDRPEELQSVSGHAAFREKFKDGVMLCELLNKLSPNCIKKYHKSPKLAFQQMENIGFANEAMREYGVQSEYIFVTNDLYQGKNLYQVQLGLRNLGDKANNKGFTPKFQLWIMTMFQKVSKVNKRSLEQVKQNVNNNNKIIIC